jgi:hypothetical protein
MFAQSSSALSIIMIHGHEPTRRKRNSREQQGREGEVRRGRVRERDRDGP